MNVRAVFAANDCELAVCHVVAMSQSDGSVVPRARPQRQAYLFTELYIFCSHLQADPEISKPSKFGNVYDRWLRCID